MIFDPFGDFETRGYLRNVLAEKDPRNVKRQEHHVFRLRIGEALDALHSLPSLRYRDLLETHRRLFGDYYPWAGRDRLDLLPDMAVGKAGRFDLFAHPQDVRRAAEYALDVAQNQEGMVRRPGEVMGLLAYAHCFLDGNGWTIMTVHAELARRADIHIAWADIDKQSYLTALTHELDRPAQVLDRFLAPYIGRGAVASTEMAEALRAHPGLGPPAGQGAGALADRADRLKQILRGERSVPESEAPPPSPRRGPGL